MALDLHKAFYRRDQYAITDGTFSRPGGPRPAAAADQLQHVINDLEDTKTRGWLREQKAADLHLVDPVTAQQQLTVAVGENPFVLRPIVGVLPTRATATVGQAQAAATFFTATYTDGTSLVLGVKAMLEDIAWDPDGTDQAEAAWQRLGEHLGFVSTRPDKTLGVGPDNLWVSADRHAVIELKTGAAAAIAKRDLDQLGGSVRWAQQQYPGVRTVPVLVHPVRGTDAHGTPVQDMRVVTPAMLDRLKTAVTTFAVALAGGMGRWGDQHAVAEQLRHGHLTAGDIFQTYAETARQS